jgi:membrane-bound serine protease (ClpP class)
MTAIILLFALAILLLAVEVIVPGGILGGIGALLMLGGCVLSFSEYGTSGGFIAMAAALTLTILVLWFEFKILPHTAVGKRAFLTRQITGVSAAYGSEAQDLIGKTAQSITMLSPTGYVTVDGKRHEAFCDSGQVPAGSTLEVTGADNFRLIVSPTKTNKH